VPAHAAYCVESWPTSSDRHAYAVFLLLSTYVGPIVAIIVSYALIGRSLCLGAASATSTPSSSVTARGGRPPPSTTGRGLAGGLPPVVGVDSWPCAGGPAAAVAAVGGTRILTPSIPAPMSSGRCSRGGGEAGGTPAGGGSGLQVPVRGSSSSTSSSGRKKAAAALLVAGYSAAAAEGGGAAANVDRGTVTIAPGCAVVHRRHAGAAAAAVVRLNHVPTAGPHRDAINRSRRSVVRLLVTIVVVFVASWLPYNVVSLRVDLNLDAGEARVLPFALWLGHAHSAVNPVVYWFFNKTGSQERLRYDRTCPSSWSYRTCLKPKFHGSSFLVTCS